jgi:NADPH:quinone reductase-like Zn-dependent oxidoreductase
MRAVAVTEFGGTPELMELPDPVAGPGEILVRLAGAALNPFDRAISDGFLRHLPHTFPLILGADGAGVVEQVGEEVETLEVGDAVYGIFIHEALGLGRGTLAEYVAVPSDAVIGPAPSRVSLVEAAAAPTAGMTAIGLVEETGVAAGQKVLIVGASGGVGSFATQLAAARGARVIATARPDATDRLRSLGAAETVDYGQRSVAEQLSEIEPGGVDVLLDLVSDPEAFATNLELVRDGGRAMSIRYAAQAESLGSDRIGVVNFNLREHPGAPGFLETLAAALDAGRLQVVIDAEVPLEQAPAAIASRSSGGARGKTVVTI